MNIFANKNEGIALNDFLKPKAVKLNPLPHKSLSFYNKLNQQ